MNNNNIDGRRHNPYHESYEQRIPLGNRITDTCSSVYFANHLMNWRNEDLTTSDRWGRRFAVILPLVLVSIVGVIDSLASLILSLILAPLELFGIQLSRNFLGRAGYGLFYSFLDLTFAQYTNFAHEKISYGF